MSKSEEIISKLQNIIKDANDLINEIRGYDFPSDSSITETTLERILTLCMKEYNVTKEDLEKKWDRDASDVRIMFWRICSFKGVRDPAIAKFLGIRPQTIRSFRLRYNEEMMVNELSGKIMKSIMKQI